MRTRRSDGEVEESGHRARRRYLTEMSLSPPTPTSLAMCYSQGLGVSLPSARKSLKYYVKAVELGCSSAVESLHTLRSNIDSVRW